MIWQVRVNGELVSLDNEDAVQVPIFGIHTNQFCLGESVDSKVLILRAVLSLCDVPAVFRGFQPRVWLPFYEGQGQVPTRLLPPEIGPCWQCFLFKLILVCETM